MSTNLLDQLVTPLVTQLVTQLVTLPSILIVGNRRTGRSTLALELVRRLGAPQLDVFCHETEWKSCVPDECTHDFQDIERLGRILKTRENYLGTEKSTIVLDQVSSTFLNSEHGRNLCNNARCYGINLIVVTNCITDIRPEFRGLLDYVLVLGRVSAEKIEYVFDLCVSEARYTKMDFFNLCFKLERGHALMINNTSETIDFQTILFPLRSYVQAKPVEIPVEFE